MDRRIKWEVVISVASILVLGGIAWGQTQSSVNKNAGEIEEIHETQTATNESIVEIEKNVAVIQNDVENMKSDIGKLQESVEEDLKEIKEILKSGKK